MVDMDETCVHCGLTRDEHGDSQHKFSLDGQLIPIDPPPKPSREAPRHRDDPPAPAGVEVGPDLKLAFATLVEVLAEKKISFDGVNRPLLDTKDVIRIFSGKG